jgi:hypothetical protein
LSEIRAPFRRKIFLCLLIASITMLIAAIIRPYEYGPGTDLEILYLVIGIPIKVLNMWEWSELDLG